MIWAAVCPLLILAAPVSLRAQNAQGFRALGVSHQGVPAYVSGTEFVYDYKTDTIVARGDAILTQGPTVIRADELDYTRNRREARAYGHVNIKDPEMLITASQAELNLDDETGRLLDGDVRLSGDNYHLVGKEITKLFGQHYQVRQGSFTTCGCEGTPSWRITADQIDAHIGGTGTVSGAHLDILGYPVLPLPYAVFPADSERSSGLLAPRIGESGLRGFQYFQPYYLAIDKSSDATLAFDVESKERVGFLGEYRLMNGQDDYFRLTGGYMDESINGNPAGDVVDDQISDQHVPLDRYEIIANTRQHLTPDLTAYGDTVTVSDSLYLRDMNVWTLSRGYGGNFGVTRDAISHFGLLDSFDDGFLRLDGIWNEDLIQDQQFTLQTLPELLLSGRQDLGGGFAYSDYDLQAVDFWRQTGVRGTRFDFNPRVTVPWRISDYLAGFATLGGRETVYDTSGHEVEVTPVGTDGLSYNNSLALGGLNPGGLRTRELLYGSAGVSSEIEKIYDLNWGSIEKLKHTIEPVATYSFVPKVAQGSLPLYDETDRVNARSLVSYGVVSRFFVKMSPEASPAQPGANRSEDDLDDDSSEIEEVSGNGNGEWVREVGNLSLLQAYDLTHTITSAGSHMSDLDLGATLFPTSIASFGSGVGYNPQSERITGANVNLTLRPPWVATQQSLYMGRAATGPFLEIAYNFVGGNAASQAFSARVYYELFDRIGVYYAPLYDIAGGKLLSAEYGLRIKSKCNCWALDFGVSDTTNPNELGYQFELTLGGLGSIGQNPFGRNPFRNYYGGTSSVLPSVSPSLSPQ
ncbi:MAG: LPS-assembly protein LptD [Candidatus Binatales bacterium]